MSTPPSYKVEANAKSSPGLLSQLDAEIQEAEYEINEMNKKYMNHIVRPNTSLKVSTSASPIQPIARSKTPVFEASLCTSGTKSKVQNGSIMVPSPRSEQKKSSLERYKKFEQKKKTYFQKYSTNASMIEPYVDRSNGKVKTRQTDPLLFLDIVLAPDVIVRVPVTKMDTPSFLAEKCFIMANITPPKQAVKRLSEVIQTAINEEIAKIVNSVKVEKEKIYKENIEKEQRMKEIKREREKEFNLWTNKRAVQRETKGKVLGKLSVLIGKSKTADIIIREGDDPAALVENFLTTFCLSRDLTQTFLNAIENLIEKANNAPPLLIEEVKASPEFTKKTPSAKIERSKTPVAPPATGSSDKVLFRVRFNTENGGQVSLDVKKNDNLYQVAHHFVTTNGLGMDKVQTVWECLKELYKVIFFCFQCFS